MCNSASLIPARFLTLVAHLIVNIVLLTWNTTENVKNCLPKNANPILLSSLATRLNVGLSVAVGMIGFELLAFLAGFTMFNNASSLLSAVSHAFASILLSYFALANWNCDWFWWIFVFGSVLPLIYDLKITFEVIRYKKY